MMEAAARVLVLFVMFLTVSSCDAVATINIQPDSSDVDAFEGAEFVKLCDVNGVSEGFNVRIIWERDGAMVDEIDLREGPNYQLEYRISQVEQVHQGEYTCRAVLTPQSSGATISIPPVSAGVLTVIGQDSIFAPAIQFIQEGSTGRLRCDTEFITEWRRARDGATVIDGRIESATFADEGVYICDVFDGESASTIRSIMLYVVAPIEVLETTRPVHQNLTNNQPLVFAVDFMGRQSHNLLISWFHNNVTVAPDDTRIRNTFNSDRGSGRTELSLRPVRRSDAGLYRVEISTWIGSPGEQPLFASQREVTFQIDITVRPAPPEGLRVDQISSRTARVSWTLANQMLDQAADRLMLHVTFANRSLVDSQLLSGDATSATLESLIPAHEYLLTLRAENADGEVTTNPVPFTSREGPPVISLLLVERLNRTSFAMMIHLAYTGGGAVATVDVAYRPRASSRLWTALAVEEEEYISPLTIRVMVVLTDDRQQPAAVELDAAMELTFIAHVQNEFEYSSSGTANVSAFMDPVVVSTTMSATMSAGTAGTSSPETGLLPLWLIAVIASVVTVLVMVVMVACILALCRHCRASSRSEKFKVQAPPTTTLQAVENGMFQAKSSDSSAVEQIRARSQSSSLPSDTPSLDENYKKHKRELSEGSSMCGITKPPITPSTTASNSPSNFSKAHFLNSQDKGLDSITELQSHGSGDSGTESERDRTRHQQQLQQQRHQQQLQQRRMYEEIMSVSPCSRNNMINYQYVQNGVDEQRGHADGSLCANSHQSLVSSSRQSINYSPMQCQDTKHLHHLHHHQVPSRKRGAEYMYSDGESVASTDVSCSNLSLSSSYHNPQNLRPVQHRSPTPYNHDYSLTEGSVV